MHYDEFRQSISNKIEEKLEWRNLATFVPNKLIPIHRWFYFKEGFAKELVGKIIGMFGIKEGAAVLDPFCGCYDSKTEVLTLNGWKHFAHITPEDKVATLNPLTEELEYQNPIRFFNYKHTGKMYRVMSKQVDLFVTPNHSMFVALRKALKPKKLWKFELTRPENIFGKSVIYKKNSRWNGLEERVFKLGNKELDMDAWLFFFGLWLAEGSAMKYKRKTGKGFFYCVQIRNMDNKILHKVADVSRRLGFNPIYTPGSKIRIYNKELYQHLNQFGKAPDKFIPQDLKLLSSRQLNILLEAYLLGDGNSMRAKKQLNPTARCWTVSAKLRDDIQEIALKVGFSANFSKSVNIGRVSLYRGRNIIAKHDIWVLTIIKAHNNPRIYSKRSLWDGHEIIERWEDFEGDVWCVGVPNHTLYVRRNGKPVWCGNSGTTLLACKQSGINSVGFDVLPVSVFASRVKTQDHNIEALETNLARLRSAKFRPLRPDVPNIIKRAFSRFALEDIVFLQSEIAHLDLQTREFFTLALMNAAMKASYAYKDGSVIKFRKKPVPPLRKLFVRTAKNMIKDLKNSPPGKAKAEVLLQDARRMPLGNESVDAIITSPPYLNNIDYTKVYAIEEFFIRGGAEPGVRAYVGLSEKQSDFLAGEIDLPVQARLYFEDMNRVLQECYRVLKKNGGAAFIVGNGYAGEIVESDIILAYLAEKIGFAVEKIYVLNTRFALEERTVKRGVLRESMLVLRK